MVFFESKYPVFNAIILFIIIVIILYISKPDFIYSRKYNKFKQFGINKDETIVSFPILCLSSSIFSYFIFYLIEELENKENK